MKQYIHNMRNKDFVLLIGSILAFILFVSLCGCKTTQHKRDRQLTKLDNIKFKCDHSEVLKGVPEEWTIKNYPIRERIVKGKTVYTKGETIVKKGDTVYRYVNCDSLVKAGKGKGHTNKVKVPCPPCDTTYIHDTLYAVDTAYQYSTAEANLKNKTIDSLKSLLVVSSDKLQSAEHKATARLYWALGLGLLSLLLISFIVLVFLGKIR